MNVGVLGAGELGRGIAQVCARGGHQVGLHDEEATEVMDGIDAIERAMTDDDREHSPAADRLDGTTDLDGVVSGADVIVETRPVDGDVLRSTFATVEDLATREALIATARETGRVTAAAAGLQHPGRAVGLYFFAPLAVALVEVIAADQTTPESADRAVAFVESIDHRPVLARDVPGAVTRRLTLAQEVEAMRLVNDGVTGVADVDDALASAYDLAVGPLERADRAGLDARLAALETLTEAIGDRFDPPPVLRDLVAAGHTGLDSGEGFYEWENGEPAGSALPDPEIPHTTADEPSSGR